MENEVADLLIEGKIGAIFQGSPEMGSRALGNRSVIADPRMELGKDLVNKVKNREWYRPFAASVLQEEVHNWFQMGRLTSSPWMLYAIPVIDSKWKQIPAVIHIDGTCRVQTVDESRGPYYNIIKSFYAKTGVPLVLNTSLNKAGEPLIHTKEESLEMLHNSSLDFIYFPEENKIIRSKLEDN
jgi:carbamoyltransferase